MKHTIEASSPTYREFAWPDSSNQRNFQSESVERLPRLPDPWGP